MPKTNSGSAKQRLNDLEKDLQSAKQKLERERIKIRSRYGEVLLAMPVEELTLAEFKSVMGEVLKLGFDQAMRKLMDAQNRPAGHQDGMAVSDPAMVSLNAPVQASAPPVEA